MRCLTFTDTFRKIIEKLKTINVILRLIAWMAQWGGLHGIREQWE